MAEISLFDNIPSAPPIEVFHLNQLAKEDKSDKKVNMTIGAYRDENGQPWVLPVVKNAQRQLVEDNSLDKEYLPITGLASFCEKAPKILYGNDCKSLIDGNYVSVQSVAGTGALRLALQLLSKLLDYKIAYVSSPTWPNHKLMVNDVGMALKEYRYSILQRNDHGDIRMLFDFDGMIADLNAAEPKSVVVLHGVAHNPTGTDPSPAQWEEIVKVCKAKELFPILDVAYQGFASGDLDKDGYATRLFEKNGFELASCQSFSKNFGLYNERVGCLTFIVRNKTTVPAIKSQLALMIRKIYSNPPATGCRIVTTVLENTHYYTQWLECLRIMSSRMYQMRQLLVQKLRSAGVPGPWPDVAKQNGMFTYTGMSRAQVDRMRDKHHVYMMSNGRMNICALTLTNIDHVVEAMTETIKEIPFSV